MSEFEIFRRGNAFRNPPSPCLLYWQPSSEVTQKNLNQILDSPVDSPCISKTSDYVLVICDSNFNNLPLHFQSEMP